MHNLYIAKYIKRLKLPYTKINHVYIIRLRKFYWLLTNSLLFSQFA